MGLLMPTHYPTWGFDQTSSFQASLPRPDCAPCLSHRPWDSTPLPWAQVRESLRGCRVGGIRAGQAPASQSPQAHGPWKGCCTWPLGPVPWTDAQPRAPAAWDPECSRAPFMSETNPQGGGCGSQLGKGPGFQEEQLLPQKDLRLVFILCSVLHLSV